ncbi:MAG: protein kinase [Pirellulaceae bacterium]
MTTEQPDDERTAPDFQESSNDEAHAPNSESDDLTAVQDAVELKSAASRSTSTKEDTPKSIDEYEIDRQIGQGGMGTVYLANDTRLNRQVAIKIVSKSSREKASVRQRFESEIRSLAGLQHQYIARLFSAGEFDGSPYFVMEFINGPTLDEMSRDLLPHRQVAQLMCQLCEAVEYCHQQGMVHRDLKPSNILMHRKSTGDGTSSILGSVSRKSTLRDAHSKKKLSRSSQVLKDSDEEATAILGNQPQSESTEGDSSVEKKPVSDSGSLVASHFSPKIADFGLAKLIHQDSSQTKTGEILGTPSYMAPEQASAEKTEITPSCDVYALGAILYKLLTGRAPFVSEDPFKTILQVLQREPVKPQVLTPSVPAELEIICLKCLEKSPTRRYASAEELRQEFVRYLDGRPILAKPSNWMERSVKWGRRNPTIAATAGAAVAGILLTIGGLSWHSSVLSTELAKTRRLASNGSDLSQWLVQDHLIELNKLSGTTDARFALVQRVQDFLEKSLDDMPPDPDYTKQLGYSFERLASVAGGVDQNNLGKLEVAEQNYLHSIELYDRALLQQAKRRQVLLNKANALLGLARVYQELDRPADHLSRLEEAALILEETGKENWSSLFLHVLLLENHVELDIERQQYAKAAKGLDEVESMLAQAPADAEPLELTNQRIWLATTRSQCQEMLGNLSNAETLLSAALQLAKSESDREPLNALMKRRYATVLVRMGDIETSLEKIPKALASYQQATEIVDSLLKKDPTSFELAGSLASNYSRVSTLQIYLQQLPAAEASIDKALAICTEFSKRGLAHASLDESVAIYTLTKAEIHIETGETEEALLLLGQHRELCLAKLHDEPESNFYLGQMAEQCFRRAMLQTNHWFALELDPRTARENEHYVNFQAAAKELLAYSKKIDELNGLNYHQASIRDQMVKIQELIEKSLDEQIQLIEQEENDSEGGNVPSSKPGSTAKSGATQDDAP